MIGFYAKLCSLLTLKPGGLLPPLPPLNPYPQRLKTRTPYEGTGFEGVGVRVEF
jgi:hypothetical protein